MVYIKQCTTWRKFSLYTNFSIIPAAIALGNTGVSGGWCYPLWCPQCRVQDTPLNVKIQWFELAGIERLGCLETCLLMCRSHHVPGQGSQSVTGWFIFWSSSSLFKSCALIARQFCIMHMYSFAFLSAFIQLFLIEQSVLSLSLLVLTANALNTSPHE